MSLIERLIRNSSHSVMAGLTGAIGSFVASAVVARTLGVGGTASVAIALWIVFFATTISDIGLTGSLARFMPRHHDVADDAGLRAFVSIAFKALVAAILLGLLLTSAILVLYWSDIEQKYSSYSDEALTICVLILACFVIHMLFAFCYQYLRGLRQFKAISRFSIVGAILQVVGVTFGSVNYGVVGALLGYILASVPMLWVLGRLRIVRAAPPLDEMLEVRRYAISFYIAALFSPLLWSRADLLLLDQIEGAEAVGLFAAAATVAALLIQVCQMVCNALLPNIVHAAAKEPTSFPEISATATRFGMFILLPACLVGAALAPGAIGLIYGAEFVEAGPTAALLGCAAAASAVTLVISGVLNAANANSALVRSGAVGAVLTIGLGILFVTRFGMIGAAIGRLSAQAVVAAMNVAAANAVVPHLIRAGWFLRYLVTSAAAGLVAMWVASIGEGFFLLMLAGFAGTLTYLLLALLCFRMVRQDREALLRSIATQPPPLKKFVMFLVGVAPTQKD